MNQQKPSRFTRHALALGYTESQGHPLLREEIAALYETVPPEGVLVFSGAEEAIFALANVAVGERPGERGPGRRAAVVWPACQSLHEVARSAGAEVDLLELGHEDGWSLDPEALRDLVKTPQTTGSAYHDPS